MIVVWVWGRAYADRAWLHATYGVSRETIRRRLTPAWTDPHDGHRLYDLEAAHLTLSTIRTRRRA